MQVQTTGGKLVVMLYDGAVRFLTLALEAMDRHDLEEQGRNVSKAQQILCHLMGTLNFEAGSLATDLYALYEFSIRRLMRANVEDDRASVETVRAQLMELREAWDVAERKVSGEAARSAYIASRG
jgi:flagellar protein FliS